MVAFYLFEENGTKLYAQPRKIKLTVPRLLLENIGTFLTLVWSGFARAHLTQYCFNWKA